MPDLAKVDERILGGQGFLMQRHASLNALPIHAEKRLFHWPLGRPPDDHPGPSDLGQ